MAGRPEVPSKRARRGESNGPRRDCWPRGVAASHSRTCAACPNRMRSMSYSDAPPTRSPRAPYGPREVPTRDRAVRPVSRTTGTVRLWVCLTNSRSRRERGGGGRGYKRCDAVLRLTRCCDGCRRRERLPSCEGGHRGLTGRCEVLVITLVSLPVGRSPRRPQLPQMNWLPAEAGAGVRHVAHEFDAGNKPRATEAGALGAADRRTTRTVGVRRGRRIGTGETNTTAARRDASPAPWGGRIRQS